MHADLDSADDCSVRPDCGSLFDNGPLKMLRTISARPGIQVVGEHSGRTEETIVTYLNSVPYQDGILDSDPIPQHRTVLNECTTADIAVFADLRPAQYMSEGPDSRARPDIVALAEAMFVDKDSVLFRAIHRAKDYRSPDPDRRIQTQP